MLKIRVKTDEQVSTFLREEKDRFFDAIIEAITDGLENGLAVVRVAEFAITDEDIIKSIDIEEDDWNESLHLGLYYFEGIQEYEKCIVLQKLIDELYDD